MHEGPSESLVKKKAHVEVETGPAKIRVRSIKRNLCVEVGHDRFDEVVADFLQKTSQENIISITPINYAYIDVAGNVMPDYGVLIIYKA